MLYRIAITPDVFTNAALRPDGEKMLSPLWNIFQDTGLLLDYNNGQWGSYIKDLDLPLSMHDKILTQLSRLKDRNRIINFNGHDMLDGNINQWSLLISEAKEKGVADLVICSEDSQIFQEQEILLLGSKNEIVEFPIEFSDPAFRKIDEFKNWRLKKTEDEIFNVVLKIFRHAKMATIVDPYLNCKHEYYQRSIALIAKTLNSANSQTSEKYLNIYASKKKSGYTKLQFNKIWVPFLRNIADNFNVQIFIALLGASKKHEHLHDRFLFSEQCGVSIPSDFTVDKRGKEREATWQLLTYEKYAKLVEEFSSNLNFPIVAKRRFLTTPLEGVSE